MKTRIRKETGPSPGAPCAPCTSPPLAPGSGHCPPPRPAGPLRVSGVRPVSLRPAVFAQHGVRESFTASYGVESHPLSLSRGSVDTWHVGGPRAGPQGRVSERPRGGARRTRAHGPAGSTAAAGKLGPGRRVAGCARCCRWCPEHGSCVAARAALRRRDRPAAVPVRGPAHFPPVP